MMLQYIYVNKSTVLWSIKFHFKAQLIVCHPSKTSFSLSYSKTKAALSYIVDTKALQMKYVVRVVGSILTSVFFSNSIFILTMRRFPLLRFAPNCILFLYLFELCFFFTYLKYYQKDGLQDRSPASDYDLGEGGTRWAGPSTSGVGVCRVDFVIVI